MNTSRHLAAIFVSHLVGDELGNSDDDGLERELEGVIKAANARWPTVIVAPERFTAYLAERVPADAADLQRSLKEMHTSDLYLACACADGNETAIAAFEEAFTSSIGPSLSRLDKTGTITDDAKQKLRERLFLCEAERPAKIGDYQGRGELRMWVRAVAVRIGLDLLRGVRRSEARREDDDVLEALADSDDDPELAYLREHYGEALRDAFARAIEALPSKQRHVLRCHFVDRLNVEQIGRIYQVHKTTAFRWLEKARGSLVEATRARMQEVLGLESNQVDSVMRLIKSDLQLSLSRLLKDAVTDKSS